MRTKRSFFKDLESVYTFESFDVDRPRHEEIARMLEELIASRSAQMNLYVIQNLISAYMSAATGSAGKVFFYKEDLAA